MRSRRRRERTVDFETIVAEALAQLPLEIQRRMENVQVVIADWPTRAEMRRAGLGPHQTLFGLYEGVPLTERTSGYHLVPPDKITIFEGPIAAAFRSPDEMREQVRRTVLHEVGHHFGMDEAQLRALDY
ncbi:MAG: metallopeptidase family protein [Chloroflexi bacterium]|nr:metallopeptidase family protein [Chloroflexota bacterium]